MLRWLRKRWATESTPRRPECMVHDRYGGVRRIDYRYVRYTICTCYPIPVAKEPPTEPATPPSRKD